MRNLKRVLSLSLASIMLLGMMVIGSSAAQDYSDVDYDNDNIEAIEVLDAINVMRGDLDANGELAGTFRPGSDVKRSEMARIMAFLMDLDYDYYIGVNPFTDMVGHWAEKYAAACAANGIIYGRTTGPNAIYDPDATVTAVEAASMLMRALGYFQNPAVDQPNGFEIDTIRQAGKINLFKRVDAKTNEPMTRNDVAQLVLNALQSGMVEPSTNSKIDVTVGDAQVSIGSSNYVYTVARDPVVGNAINTTKAEGGNSSTGLEGDILDLGEKLYDGKLRLNSGAIDDYGRPSRRWEFDGSEIGTYAKTELLRGEPFKVSVKGSDMYNLLGSSVVTDARYKLKVWVDGWNYTENYLKDKTITGNYNYFDKANFTRNNDTNLQNTGRGVLTEVYEDTSTHEITVAIINTYLAKATADYNTGSKKLNISVYTGIASGQTVPIAKSLDVEDFPQIETAKKDDFFLVQWADLEQAASKKVVMALGTPGIMTDVTVTKFSTTGNAPNVKVNKMTVDGTEYQSNANLAYDAGTLNDYDKTLLTNKTYNVYLDQFDNAIGAELYSGTDNYVFITGVDLNNSSLSNVSADANAIFLDGTMDVIKVNVKDTNDAIKDYNGNNGTNPDYPEWKASGDGTMADAETRAKHNTWYYYTLNEAKNEYTLEPVDQDRQLTNYVDRNSSTSLNSKNVRFNSVNDRVDYAPNTPTANDLVGYGNEKSIFITVGTDDLTSPAATRVISEVTGCFTNIQDVDIISEEDADDPSIFAVLNKNRYIVGAVVIGENAGSGANYAYILGTAKSEEKIDDTYYWDFDAIVDGEFTTLTVKSKYVTVVKGGANSIHRRLDNTMGTNTADRMYAHGYLFRLT